MNGVFVFIYFLLLTERNANTYLNVFGIHILRKKRGRALESGRESLEIMEH